MKLFILNFPLKVFFYHPLLIVSLQHDFFFVKGRKREAAAEAINTNPK